MSGVSNKPRSTWRRSRIDGSSSTADRGTIPIPYRWCLLAAYLPNRSGPLRKSLKICESLGHDNSTYDGGRAKPTHSGGVHLSSSDFFTPPGGRSPDHHTPLPCRRFFFPHGPPPLSLSPFSPCLTDDRRGHPEKQRRIIHHPAQRNGDQHKPLSKKVLHVRGAFAEPTSVTQSPTVPSAARSQRAFRVFF